MAYLLDANVTKTITPKGHSIPLDDFYSAEQGKGAQTPPSSRIGIKLRF